MASHGREVLRAKLLHRRKGAGTWKRRSLVAYCGQSPAPSARLELLGDYEDTSKRTDQKPKDVIDLDGAKIETTTNGGSPSGSQGSSPYSTIGSSPSSRNSLVGSPPSKNSTLGTSPSSQGPSATQYIFQVLCSGKSHEFRTDSENDRIRWVKLLGLLVMFPFAPIPKEPESNPIAESFHCKLDAKKFGAVSAWAVYILPEDVGTTCQIIGLNVLVLKGGRGNKTVGRLEICNPVDPRNPTVSWDRDKMRRTGKTGNLVFIEIGRRCKGGPGLVWMYAGFGEAQALRETLHNFLFQGDGKAVPVMTTAVPLYDNPRASFDSSLPASYKRRGSSTPDSSNPYQHVPRDPDSGYPASPASYGLDGPPVRLDKHPSFRKQRSAPCDIHNGRRSQRRSNTQSISSSMSERDSTAESFSEDLLFDQEDSLPTPTRSPSPPEHPVDEGCFMGSMDEDDIVTDGLPKRSYTEPAVGAEKPKSVCRCHSTATCQAASRRVHEYEVMVHPKVADMYNRDGYTYMNPAELKSQAPPPPPPTVTRSAPIPVSHQSGEVASGHLLPSAGSSPSSTSPRKYAHYDRLPTIAEREARERQREAEETQRDKSSPYENYPLPPSVQNSAPVYYTPNYQNVSLAHSDRRGSQNREEYENVTWSGEQISDSPTGGSRLQKNGSIRRSRPVKEDVRLPLKGNGLSINGKEVKSPSPPQKTGLQYIEVEHSSESEGHTNPTVSNVPYSAIDMVSTNVFHSLQRERKNEEWSRARTSVV